jgi:hypothetical protein
MAQVVRCWLLNVDILTRNFHGVPISLGISAITETMVSSLLIHLTQFVAKYE